LFIVLAEDFESALAKAILSIGVPIPAHPRGSQNPFATIISTTFCSPSNNLQKTPPGNYQARPLQFRLGHFRPADPCTFRTNRGEPSRRAGALQVHAPARALRSSPHSLPHTTAASRRHPRSPRPGRHGFTRAPPLNLATVGSSSWPLARNWVCFVNFTRAVPLPTRPAGPDSGPRPEIGFVPSVHPSVPIQPRSAASGSWPPILGLFRQLHPSPLPTRSPPIPTSRPWLEIGFVPSTVSRSVPLRPAPLSEHPAQPSSTMPPAKISSSPEKERKNDPDYLMPFWLTSAPAVVLSAQEPPPAPKARRRRCRWRRHAAGVTPHLRSRRL